jgi:hypothetical protein
MNGLPRICRNRKEYGFTRPSRNHRGGVVRILPWWYVTDFNDGADRMGQAADYELRSCSGTALASAVHPIRTEGSHVKNLPRSWIHWPKAALNSLRVFLQDTGHGLLEVCHSSLALLGLVVISAMLLFVAAHPELRQELEQQLRTWLQARHEERERLATGPAVEEPDWTAVLAEPAAVLRATALDPAELDRQQAAVAYWLSRRYRVAPEPIGRLVREAWEVGRQASIDPTLILAVMAIESAFNPFAQSPVGAQGLMQVMTRIHEPKYEAFGGSHAAFDPVTNLRVGVQVLKECIQRAGSLERGLKFYVGAANLADDGGYASKVLAEQSFLRQVVQGLAVSVVARSPTYLSNARPTVAPEPVPEMTPAAPAVPAPAPAAPGKAVMLDAGDQVALLRGTGALR